MLSVADAIAGRQNIRAFDPERAVSQDAVERILQLAARAPNGSNIQPWKVDVLTGSALADFSAAIGDACRSGVSEPRDYAYYMSDWRQPYLDRRRATGWGLYGLLGIKKGDRAGSTEQMVRNYSFFDAPVGMILWMDRDMGEGAWIDMGCFVQTMLLAARGEGLEACPLASFANYPARIRDLLGLPETALVLTGIAIGYPKAGAAVNTYRTPREPISRFTKFHRTLPGLSRADGQTRTAERTATS